VALAEVERLAEQALEAGLLHGPEYQARRAAALAAYRAGPRAPACAGSSYPEEPARLARMLDAFCLGGGQRAPAAKAARLLVAPHIDFARGGLAYAHAYQTLERSRADLFVVFGTAHASPEGLFTITRQDYATPLGAVPVDRDAVDALVAELGEGEVLADELFHRAEHSCEFQMVWLRHVLGHRRFTALPVLCASISHLRDPSAGTARFLRALERAARGREVCFVAGADLAHVGPQYGDARSPTPAELAGLAAQDRRTLAFLAAGDAPGFHRDATRDDARRRLCGVAPIYAAMRASGLGARVLHYQQWSDGVDSVSFAAAAG